MNLSHMGIKSFNDPQIKEIPHTVEKLYLYGNQIESFEFSENLPKGLKELNLYNNHINSFKFSENLPKGLKVLNLPCNQIGSFEFSENLPKNLKELNLWYSQINSFEHSESLPRNLEILILRNNQISSFKGCENLPRNLKNLYINWNQSWSKEQRIILGTQFELENVLELVKFLQRHQDFKYILNEIKYNPHLERMKSKLEEEEKQIKKDPESFYKLII